MGEPIYLIKVKNNSGSVPIGTILLWLSNYSIPRGWLLANGSELKIEEYPELYNSMGDQYQPKTVDKPTLFRKILRFVGIKIQYQQIPNPDYRPGYFRIPEIQFNCLEVEDDTN